MLPFANGVIEEVKMINVLEHIQDVISVMEEIWRVCSDDAYIVVRVPFWNSVDFAIDPTHKSRFHFSTFDFFDPDTPRGRKREYYSQANFTLKKIHAYIRVGKYIKVSTQLGLSIQKNSVYLLNSIVRVIEFELLAKKD